ncbi:uncharacterized protein BO97DRAFT_7291 [Aspergillus homomorphus CBS 101889]|uniref:Uncharacterized protein n=1 Tax=Aspergillus homomorphus (strain CBS 101889) TaxID=1450537 RepID=A0A395IBA1_ASPHC|nr:hypothetical protein BO97DRAFT_7291 [Aspergillus homomorphus CBS 101889]RAL17502.1 hypothetical protein BO97DRAFT_7291 [Aspergillus homomorphus CBS 101889]
MVGSNLEFDRNYDPVLAGPKHEMYAIGQVDSTNIVDSTTTKPSIDNTPHGNIEVAASEVQPPRISENFMAPVNEGRDLFYDPSFMDDDLHDSPLDHQQEMPGVDHGIVCHLVSKGLIAADAIEIVQSKRDSPTHGIGLQSVGQRGALETQGPR